MANIIDYANEAARKSFFEDPFNPLDSLLLSQLSYVRFDGIVPDVREKGSSISLKDILGHATSRDIFQSVVESRSNEKLFIVAAHSQRFGGIRLNFFSNEIDADSEKQFAAVTFLLEDGSAYIAYRGTDESIVGWKEDFNMAFLYPVPSQMRGVEYLNRVGTMVTGTLRLGGHSKGGNIAVYTAMKCDPSIQGRISDIYSFDGPGFRNEVFIEEEFLRIRDRIHKYLPHTAIIGMLLQNQEEYKVVESRQIGLLQHDLFSWQMSDGDFIYKPAISRRSAFLNSSLNEWLNSVGDDDRRKFVDAFYHFIQSTNAQTLFDFSRKNRKNNIKILEAIAEIDPETRHFLTKTVGSLFAIAAKDARKRRREKIRRFLFGNGKKV
jgi:hypothetical protein